MTKATAIKNSIEAILNSLKRQEVLADVQRMSPKKNLLSMDFSAFPVAVLPSAATSSVAYDNTDNLRTYTFQIWVLMNADDVENDSQVDDLIEAILNAFDNDVQLKGDEATGTAEGGSSPASSEPGPVEGTNYIAFSITIQAKALRQITLT